MFKRRAQKRWTQKVVLAWEVLPAVLMRLVLVCLGPSDWDACHASCQAWAALARSVTWPRQLVVRGSGKFRSVMLFSHGPLAVLHVPNFFDKRAGPIKQRFLVAQDGVLGVGQSPEYELHSRVLGKLADVTRSLWCVTRLSVVNIHGDLPSLQYLLQLPNLERVKVQRSGLLSTSTLRSQTLKQLEVDQTRVVFDSELPPGCAVNFSWSNGQWFTSGQVARLSVHAFEADSHRSRNRVFPPELCVTWSRWDTMVLDQRRWLAHDSFRGIQDLTLRGKAETLYRDLNSLPSLRRLCLVMGELRVSSLPEQLETLGLHGVRVNEGSFGRQGFCKASVVSVCRCTFGHDALLALTSRLNAVQDLTVTGTAAFFVFPRRLDARRRRLARLRFARPFPELMPGILQELVGTRLVLLAPRLDDLTRENRSALLGAVSELELRGVPKRDRHVWTELESAQNVRKIVFK